MIGADAVQDGMVGRGRDAPSACLNKLATLLKRLASTLLIHDFSIVCTCEPAQGKGDLRKNDNRRILYCHPQKPFPFYGIFFSPFTPIQVGQGRRLLSHY